MGKQAEKKFDKWKKFNQELWACHNDFDAQGPIAISWIDKMGYFNLDDNRVVELRLDSIRTIDQYEGYWVKITHKKNGEIARHYFNFNDIMDPSLDCRDDYRKDWPLYNSELCYYAHHGEWYIAVPDLDNIIEFQSTVISWIESYK